MNTYLIREATKDDVHSITNIYNSNIPFLLNHLGVPSVDESFVDHERNEMAEAGFVSGVIVEKETKNVIGVIDYKPDETVYLSLVMISSEYQNNGIGNIIYKQFEASMLALGSHTIRIDVVNDYDDHKVSYWSKHGFTPEKEIKLSWGQKQSSAVTMLKSLV
ncbi:MAG: GNAT family N-acetyltransferase [Lachnospiraceae bacterium]|nr:GNAT family N-acetyltransferase [Lachnospiraceae bacterium]